MNKLSIFIIAICTLFIFVNKAFCVEPEFIPPSPEMQKLMRIHDFSGNLYSGMLDINIPIYEIKGRSFSLPISLRYDGSGRRVEDNNGHIGLGWAISTGCYVSRVTKGLPDEMSSSNWQSLQFSASRLNNIMCSTIYNSQDYNQREYVYNLLNDGIGHYESDIFSYAIPGYSGYFIVGETGSDMGGVIKLDANPVTIGFDGESKMIIITDDIGNFYNFRPTEMISEAYRNNHYGDVCGWGLLSVESHDGMNITFDYHNTINDYSTSGITQYNIVETKNQTHYIATGNGYMSNLPTQEEYNNSSPCTSRGYAIYTIKSIDFGIGKIDFNSLDINANTRLENVTIMDKSGSLKKKLDLERPSYFSLLGGLTWKDNLGNAIEKYTFEYYPSSKTSSNMWTWDFWGFRNGLTAYPNNNGSYAGDLAGRCLSGFANGILPFADIKQANSVFSQMDMLKKITYPTGGTTEFTYEANRCSSNTIGGLRIKEVKTIDLDGNINAMTYEYGGGTVKLLPTGTNEIPALSYPCATEFNVQILDYMTLKYVNTFNKKNYFSTEFTGDLAAFINFPIVYQSVNVYENKAASSNSTKTEYNFDYQYSTTNYDNMMCLPNAFNYSSFIFENSNQDWLRLLRQCTFNNQMRFSGTSYDYFWKKSYLSSVREFRKSGSGAHKLVRSVNYNYRDSILGTYRNMRVNKLINFSGNAYDNIEYTMALGLSLPLFECKDYYYTKGHQYLDSETEIFYDLNEKPIQSTTINYSYNALRQLRSTSTLNSDGKTSREDKIYPLDLVTQDYEINLDTLPSNSGNNIYENMLFDNRYGKPLETIKYINNVQVESTRDEYLTSDDYPYKSSKVYKKLGSFSEDVVAQYNKYDAFSNPISITRKDATNVVFLWGYSGKYPIAEIINATYDEVKTALNGVAPESYSSATTPNMTNIDAIRYSSILKNAMVTTYTYLPLVGITSSTNPRGITTFYSYDSYGRLKESYYFENGNTSQKRITKAYEYNYKNK